MAERRRYSDEEKANALAALAANNGNVHLTAEQLSIPRTTLLQWANGNCHPDVVVASTGKKGPLADYLEDLVYDITGVLRGKLADTDAKDLFIGVGICVDKIRILRDQPTAITAQAISDAERAERLHRLVEAYRSNGRNGSGVDSPATVVGALPGPADESVGE